MANETITASQSWQCPAGVTSVDVECWGGGGGGGGTGDPNGGGGGGGGAYSKNSLTVVPSREYTITIGTGGIELTDGGDTLFAYDGTTLVLAKGGKHGESSTLGDPGAGGLGGAASEGVGDVKYSGGPGGSSSSEAGAGGGSSAGDAANGNTGGNASGNTPGTGATAPTNGGNGAAGGASENNGASATQVGGGGGGSGFDMSGGSGYRGEMKLTYTAAAFKPWYRSKANLFGCGV
jgi:hypothetical protein